MEILHDFGWYLPVDQLFIEDIAEDAFTTEPCSELATSCFSFEHLSGCLCSRL